MPRPALSAVVLAAALLAGCDMVGGALGIESPEKVAAARDAEGRAIGGACRNAGRAIEDCFTLNKKADKAAVFAGWRDMNDYMRENKMVAVVPQLGTQVAAVVPKPALAEADGPEAGGPDKAGSSDKAAPAKAAPDHSGTKPASDIGKSRSRDSGKARDS